MEGRSTPSIASGFIQQIRSCNYFASKEEPLVFTLCDGALTEEASCRREEVWLVLTDYSEAIVSISVDSTLPRGSPLIALEGVPRKILLCLGCKLVLSAISYDTSIN